MSRVRLVVWGLSAVLALGLAIATATRAFGGTETLPVLFTVRSFSLIDQDGRALGDRELRGHPWIASFIFTSCKTACPLLTSQQANVARRLADVPSIHFVSITVDPEHDTAAVLREYGVRHHADFRRWSFLTGEPAVVRGVVEAGFLQPVGARETRADGAYDMVHAGRLLLVDGEGRARGLYSLRADDLSALERDARSLAR